MTNLFLDRIDAAPMQGNEQFTFELQRWFSTLVDTMNTSLEVIQNQFNGLAAPQYTTAQITTLALSAPNGALWYDTDTNNIKAKVNGSVVVVV